jgi:hypothetical protein
LTIEEVSGGKSIRGNADKNQRIIDKVTITVPADVKKSLERSYTVTNKLFNEGILYGGNSIKNGVISPLKIVFFINNAMNKPTKAAMTYKPAKTAACKEKKPQIIVVGINALISKVYTGNLAEHVIKGAMSMVAILSRCEGIILADMIPGIAHAKDPNKGINERPWSPNIPINLSTKNAALAR